MKAIWAIKGRLGTGGSSHLQRHLQGDGQDRESEGPIKLYLNIKEEPTLLYDRIYRDDILAHAYHLAKAN